MLELSPQLATNCPPSGTTTASPFHGIEQAQEHIPYVAEIAQDTISILD